MEKYKLVEERRLDCDLSAVEKNEVRITQIGKTRNYIIYAQSLFKEKDAKSITLKAMGRAINKTITIAEAIKRLIAGLYQITELSTCDLLDIYDPIEEGLDRVENVRHVSCIALILSFLPLGETHIGYQPPLSPDELQHSQTARFGFDSCRNERNSQRQNNDVPHPRRQITVAPQYSLQFPTFNTPIRNTCAGRAPWNGTLYSGSTMLFPPHIIGQMGPVMGSASSAPMGIGYPYTPAQVQPGGGYPSEGAHFTPRIMHGSVYQHPVHFPNMQQSFNFYLPPQYAYNGPNGRDNRNEGNNTGQPQHHVLHVPIQNVPMHIMPIHMAPHPSVQPMYSFRPGVSEEMNPSFLGINLPFPQHRL